MNLRKALLWLVPASGFQIWAMLSGGLRNAPSIAISEETMVWLLVSIFPFMLCLAAVIIFAAQKMRKKG